MKKIKKKRKGSGSRINYAIKRECPLAKLDEDNINYKNLNLLRKYISDTGKIMSSRITNVSMKKQKILSKAIKRARVLALLPFSGN